MELYQLLSTTETPLSKNKMQKEWKVRIKRGLTYAFAVIYNQSYNKIVVKLNNCVIESVARYFSHQLRNILSLPIVIEELEFTVYFNNGECRLNLFHQDIEKSQVIQRQQPLSYEEIQDLIVKFESIRQSLQNENEKTKALIFKEQIEQLLSAQGRTNNQDNLNLIQEQLETLLILKESLEVEKRQPHPSQIPFVSNIEVSKINQPQNNENDQNNNSQPQVSIPVAQSSIKDANNCIVCMEKKSTHAPIPCGHLKYCETCVKFCLEKKECFLCKGNVDTVMRIYN